MSEPMTSTVAGDDSAAPASGAAPDWSQIAHDVLCPLCEYNLRGLSQPRCPECGYHFAWPEVADPARRLHPYLYEHHPERGLQSFLSTALHGLFPRRFWQSLNPVQPSRPRRLRGYWLRCVLLLTCFILATYLIISIIDYQRQVQAYATQVQSFTTYMQGQLARLGTTAQKKALLQQHLQTTLQVMAVNRPRSHSFIPRRTLEMSLRLVPILLVALLWPWASLLTLMIFRWSMRRARIRGIHVQRCCLYSFDGVWWSGAILLASEIVQEITRAVPVLIPATASINVPGGFLSAAPHSGASLILWLPMLFGAWKLRQAYKYYLRFDRPGWTVLASQVIVVLGLLCVWQMLDPFGPAWLISRLF